MSSFASNFVSALVTQVFSWCIRLVGNYVVPGYLSPTQFGQLVLVTATVGLVGNIFGGGIAKLLVRDIARDPSSAPGLTKSSLVLRVILWPISILATLAFSLANGYPRETVVLILLASLVSLISQMMAVVVAVFQGLELFPQANRMQLAESFVTVMIFVGLAVTKQPLWTFVVAVGIAPLISIGFKLRFLSKVLADYTGKKPGSAPVPVLTLWRESSGLMIGSVFFQIKDPLNQILMSRFAGPEAGAWFALVFRFIGTSLFVPVALATVAMPRFSRCFAAGAEAFRREVARQFRIVILATVPVSAVLIFAIVPLMQQLHFHPKYAGAVPVFQTWGSALVLWSLSVVAANALVAANQQNQVARFSLWALAIHPVSSALCIRAGESFMANGAVGAVAANILIEFFLLANFVRRLPKGDAPLIDWSMALRAVAAAIPASWLMSRIHGKEQLWIVVPALATYGVACLLLRAIGAEEMSMLTGKLGKFLPRSRATLGAGEKR